MNFKFYLEQASFI